MGNAQRFSFTEGFDGFGVPDALPQLPISLTYQDRSVEFSALLDTGASVNVLPALEFNLVRFGKSRQPLSS